MDKIKVFVSAKKDHTDEKSGIQFLKDNFVCGIYTPGSDVVEFPAGYISYEGLAIPLSVFRERYDLLYLTDQQLKDRIKSVK